MDTAILLMILLIVWAISLWGAYHTGRYRGQQVRDKPAKPSRPPATPPTEEQRRKMERECREWENFWSFDGTPKKGYEEAN